MKKIIIVMFLALVPRCSVSVHAQVWYYVWLQQEIRDRHQREAQECEAAEKAEKVRQWREKQRAVKKYGNSVSVSKIPYLVTILESDNNYLKPKQKAAKKPENSSSMVQTSPFVGSLEKENRYLRLRLRSQSIRIAQLEEALAMVEKSQEKMVDTPEQSLFASQMQSFERLSQDDSNVPAGFFQKEESLIKRNFVVGSSKNDNLATAVNVSINSANDEEGNTLGLWIIVFLISWIAFWCFAIFSSSDDSETRSLSY